MGGGEPIDRAEGSLGPPSGVLRIPPVPLLWTGVPTPSLGLTSGRTDKNLCRCFGALASAGFPLIT